MKSAAVLLVLTATALAQPHAMSPEAQAHFDRGRTLYKHRDYQGARDEFERGRAIDADPYFDFALGQVYLKLDDCKHALRAYKTFLESHPPDGEAGDAREAMARCAKSEPEAEPEPAPAAKIEAEPEPTVETPVVAPAPRPTKPPRRRHVAAPRTNAETDVDTTRETPRWFADVPGGVLASAGFAGFAVGATYLVVAEHDITAANHATTVAGIQTQSASGEHERTIGTAAMIAGGTFAVTAIVRYALVAHDHRTPDRTVSLAVAPSGAYAVWTGRF